MIAWARTLAFRLVFYGCSVPIVLCAPIAALFGQPALIGYAHGWGRLHRWLAAAILGIRVEVRGTVPKTPVLFASKHQAMFETLELAILLHGPAMVMKEELARIPFWGWAARRYGAIAVDRSASATALRHMMADARIATAKGRSILIFPEGTRVRPGETPPLRSGFAGLYRMLGLPVVPVAVDSGRLLPRQGPARPGTIHIVFGRPIPPGLKRAQAEAAVHAAINALEPSAPERAHAAG